MKSLDASLFWFSDPQWANSTRICRGTSFAPRARMIGTPGYTMLLSYAWQNDYCFPGQARLGKDIGVTERSVRTYLQELEAKGFLAIHRQGQGKSNLYVLDVRQKTHSSPRADRKNLPIKTGKLFPLRRYREKRTQRKIFR